MQSRSRPGCDSQKPFLKKDPPSAWITSQGGMVTSTRGAGGGYQFCGNAKRKNTMLARDDELNMVFFRSLGMMGGPFIQLEMPLHEFSGNDGLGK